MDFFFNFENWDKNFETKKKYRFYKQHKKDNNFFLGENRSPKIKYKMEKYSKKLCDLGLGWCSESVMKFTTIQYSEEVTNESYFQQIISIFL